MKKIFFSIVALAALAACSKSEVAYEPTDEIGFSVVAGNVTKAVVDGNVYLTALNMYVNAYVHKADQAALPTTPDYISNGEFTHRTAQVGGAEVWGGINPYYWPNEQTLHFSGFSKSGNATNTNASYNPKTDVLTITDYSPGDATDLGANDLMWFPSTKYTSGKENGYDKNTTYVTANMYHTCSWITFMIQGDATTGTSTSEYTITSLTINGIDVTADVTCTGDEDLANSNLSTYVIWSNNENKNSEYEVTISDGALASTFAKTVVDETETITKTPKNIETGATTTTGGNIVVIPQIPGSIDIEWTYPSSTSTLISDSATGLSLKLNDSNTLKWEPGKHYVYTITLGANEILISPAPVEWENGTPGNITVE